MTTTVTALKDDLIISITLRPGQSYTISREEQPTVVEGKRSEPGTLKLTVPGNCDITVAAPKTR